MKHGEGLLPFTLVVMRVEISIAMMPVVIQKFKRIRTTRAEKLKSVAKVSQWPKLGPDRRAK